MGMIAALPLLAILGDSGSNFTKPCIFIISDWQERSLTRDILISLLQWSSYADLASLSLDVDQVYFAFSNLHLTGWLQRCLIIGMI